MAYAVLRSLLWDPYEASPLRGSPSPCSLLPRLPVADTIRPPSPSEGNSIPFLMHSTLNHHFPTKANDKQQTFGSIFAMALPKEGSTNEGTLILVTAAHVLNEIGGDDATVVVRRKNVDGIYQAFDAKIIRKNGVPLFVTHPTADVAVMYGDLPNDVPMTGIVPAMLATDDRLDDIEVHPGDEIEVLGFPLAASAPGGFPILRSARIASYPLTPAKSVKGVLVISFSILATVGGRCISLSSIASTKSRFTLA